MEIRKMAGWCLILLGIVKVLHVIYLQTVTGHRAGALYAIMISLLFTGGAAFLWLKSAPERSQT